MTVTLFLSLLVFGASICALVTQAVKKAFENAKKEAAPNFLALINALLVGGFGTSVAYILLGIEWTRNNIICLILMIICIWIGSMIGFDKIKQLIEQFKGGNDAETVNVEEIQ